jgi:hypothetical protein
LRRRRRSLTAAPPPRAQGASGAALWQLAFLPDGETRAAAALEWGA